MTNNPNILVFGLPAQEELLLRKCLQKDPDSLGLVGIHPSLASVLRGPGALTKEFRRAVFLVLLDRTYHIPTHRPVSRGLDPSSLSKQVEAVRMWFPGAQVLCATNSPLRFKGEHPEGVSNPCFAGVVSYASLHQNLHFGDALKK